VIFEDFDILGAHRIFLELKRKKLLGISYNLDIVGLTNGDFYNGSGFTKFKRMGRHCF
jgi:hypothetical protein